MILKKMVKQHEQIKPFNIWMKTSYSQAMQTSVVQLHFEKNFIFRLQLITLDRTYLSFMKNKISLSIKHNNALRMTYFLNAVEDELKEISFDWKTLNLAERITAGCKFTSTSAKLPVTISVLFCDSYNDANEIGKANWPYLPKAKWSLNGDLLYLVESEDTNKVSEVLSLFAGEE
jgi:hypothetical protein